jgi:glutathione S-transferase
MARLSLVIGNKRTSSWSMRPWLLLKQTGLPFDEIKVRLRQPDTPEQIAVHSPTKRVPVLKDGDIVLWESLAICEYIAELACANPVWPENRGIRAVARSVATEMHGGFLPLRQTLSMDVLLSAALPDIPPDAAADIARIIAIWTDCRQRFGNSGLCPPGPFLFGRFTVADAMYAPVASRFTTYGVKLDPVCQAYVDAVMNLPAMAEWIEGARAEPPL